MKKYYLLLCFIISLSLFLCTCFTDSLNKKPDLNLLHNHTEDVLEEVTENPSPVLMPEIQFSTTEVYSGNYFIVYIENIDEDDEIISSTEFSQKSPEFFPYETGKIAFIGINYRTPPGNYPFTLQILRNGNILMEKEQKITVLAKDFETQRLSVTPSLQEKRSEENLVNDHVYTSKARSITHNEPLWKGHFLMPVEGRITTEFGLIRYINNVESGRHSGIDIAAPKGTSVKASNNGIVTLSMHLNVAGNTIIIDHGLNVFSSYSHLDKLLVEEGQRVQKGDIIGEVGSTGFSTGPHLHWTITISSIYVNPWLFLEEDPLHWLNPEINENH